MNHKKIFLFFKLIIAFTFIFSAYSKIIAPGYFEITLIDQGLFPNREFASYFARISIIIELAIGVLFLQPNYIKKIISPSAIILLLVFTGHLVILMMLGDNENCGCFSSLISMNPFEAIIKNIVLFFLIYYVLKNSESKQNNKFLPLTIILISILIVFIAAPLKSTSEFPFSKYTNFSSVGRVDLADGNLLVTVFDANCEHCIEAAKVIKRLDDDINDFPNVYTLIFSEDEKDIQKFQIKTGTDYPYSRINIDDFFDLIGNSPPRVYWLQDGIIEQIWDENIENELWDKFSERENKYFELNIE